MSLGTKLKEARKAKNLRQKDLAKLVGVTGSAIGNYENGVSSPNENILLRLMHVLEVDANYLYSDYFKNIPLQRSVTREEAAFLDLLAGADPVYREAALDILRNHQKEKTPAMRAGSSA